MHLGCRSVQVVPDPEHQQPVKAGRIRKVTRNAMPACSAVVKSCSQSMPAAGVSDSRSRATRSASSAHWQTDDREDPRAVAPACCQKAVRKQPRPSGRLSAGAGGSPVDVDLVGIDPDQQAGAVQGGLDADRQQDQRMVAAGSRRSGRRQGEAALGWVMVIPLPMPESSSCPGPAIPAGSAPERVSQAMSAELRPADRGRGAAVCQRPSAGGPAAAVAIWTSAPSSDQARSLRTATDATSRRIARQGRTAARPAAGSGHRRSSRPGPAGRRTRRKARRGPACRAGRGTVPRPDRWRGRR